MAERFHLVSFFNAPDLPVGLLLIFFSRVTFHFVMLLYRVVMSHHQSEANRSRKAKYDKAANGASSSPPPSPSTVSEVGTLGVPWYEPGMLSRSASVSGSGDYGALDTTPSGGEAFTSPTPPLLPRVSGSTMDGPNASRPQAPMRSQSTLTLDVHHDGTSPLTVVSTGQAPHRPSSTSGGGLGRTTPLPPTSPWPAPPLLDTLVTTAVNTKKRKRLESRSPAVIDLEIPDDANLTYRVYIRDHSDGGELSTPVVYHHTDNLISRGAFTSLDTSLRARGHEPAFEILTPFGIKRVGSEVQWDQAIMSIFNRRPSGGNVEVDIWV